MLMMALVADRADQPGLVIGPAGDIDPGGLARSGMPTVGADGDPRLDDMAAGQPGLDAAGTALQVDDAIRRQDVDIFRAGNHPLSKCKQSK